MDEVLQFMNNTLEALHLNRGNEIEHKGEHTNGTNEKN